MSRGDVAKTKARRTKARERGGATASASSQRDLARRMGVSLKAVQKWIKHPGWQWGTRAPFPLKAIATWREAVLRDDYSSKPAPPRDEAARASELEQLSISKKIKAKLDLERTKKLALEREILEGKYLLKAQVQEHQARVYAAMRSILLDVGRRVEASLDWMDEFDRKRAGAVYDKGCRQALEMLAGRRKEIDLNE